MGKGCLLGLMGENMKENILMIKNMGLVYIHGQIIDNMLVSGRMGSNMDKEYIETSII